jgi:hypothetical protein
MARLNRMFARIATSGGWALLVLILVMATAPGYAQSIRPRLRGGADREQPDPSAASTQPAAQPVPAQPAAAPPIPAQPAPSQPQAAPPVNQVAPSMLQQPAGEAQIVFTGDTLSIRADNSSLAAILHQVAGKSGMQIEGLSGDERVFGSFGPGAPRDVLADLLNGTAYNLVLLGDLGDGAPRQLILTPSTRAGAALPPPPPATTTIDEAANEQPDAEIPPPPPEVPPAGTTPPPTPGVKTPQQLFEQLQRMRSQQQQGATQDPQQQQPPQQQPPPQQQ